MTRMTITEAQLILDALVEKIDDKVHKKVPVGCQTSTGDSIKAAVCRQFWLSMMPYLEKVQFRFHRGGFDDSMSTTREITFISELRAVLMANVMFREGDVLRFEHQGVDSRNGWDTYMVLVNDQPVGYSDASMDLVA